LWHGNGLKLAHKMKIYFGTPSWGWIMYGIGYKSKWFLGFSMKKAKG
jgi:hypothetical protein